MVVPKDIDVDFLKHFREIACSLIVDHKLIIVCGGGMTARNYQTAARTLDVQSDPELDWIGIKATYLNAELVRAMIGSDITEAKVVTDPTADLDFKKDIIVAAGWKPGCSTDFDAVLLAERFGAKRLVNMSNVDYVYDKDPKKFSDAKKIEKMTWSELRKIVGDEWSPGLNAPFDPIAAKKAQKLGLVVGMIKGDDLKGLANFIKGEEFKGTIIS